MEDADVMEMIHPKIRREFKALLQVRVDSHREQMRKAQKSAEKKRIMDQARSLERQDYDGYLKIAMVTKIQRSAAEGIDP